MAEKPTDPNSGNKSVWIRFLPVFLIALILNAFLSVILKEGPTEVPLSQKNMILSEGNIEGITVKQKSNKVLITFEDEHDWDGKQFVYFTYSEGYEEKLTEELLATEYEVNIDAENPGILSALFSFLPIVLILVFFIWIFRKQMNGGPLGGMIKKSKKVETADMPKVRFSDIAGIDEVVEEIQEVKEFLEDPAKYRMMGAKIPKGILLVGSPGTGKTLLARAVAGEAGVPFFSTSGSEFVEMFVGVGASRVRNLFDDAQANAPAIVFIDEIDAVGRQRGAGVGGGNDEREQTLNQILTRMDGFGNNSGVIVIAATNRPDILDPALTRPGRFDRQITVPSPDVRGREKILQVHASGKPLADDVDLAHVAKNTAGFSGADLANLVNEAALLSARRGKKDIGMKEIEDSFDRVVMKSPARKNRVMSEEEKRMVAYHEAGHALVGFALPRVDPVTKISIVSHGSAGGFTMSVPEEDRSLYRKKALLDRISMMLGGRAAEEVVFGDDDYSTGASNDIEKATEIAGLMITTYGMSEKLGPLKWGRSSGSPFFGRDMMESKDYSEETAQIIDAEKRNIVENAKTLAQSIITEHRDALDKMAAALIKKEVVSGPEIDEIFGEDIKNSWNPDQR